MSWHPYVFGLLFGIFITWFYKAMKAIDEGGRFKDVCQCHKCTGRIRAK